MSCLVFLLQVLAVDNVNFGVHVENETRVRDTMSRRHHRVYQLYSRTSGKHIQVLGRKISAEGEDGDKYGTMHPTPNTVNLSVCLVFLSIYLFHVHQAYVYKTYTKA